MDYYKKYLKYKLKYNQIKNQTGGVQYDVCDTQNKISKDELNFNDIIEFNINGKLFKFNIQEHQSGDENIILLICTDYGIELKICIYKNNNIGKLNFVRTTQEYNLNELRHIFTCVARYFNCTELILEDDALFTSQLTNQQYRALIYRIFENKDSLYFGGEFEFIFKQKENYTLENYGIDKQLIHDSNVIDWISAYTQFLGSIKPSNVILLNEVDKILILLNQYKDSKMRDVIKMISTTADSNIAKTIKKIIDTTIQVVPFDNNLFQACRRIFKSHEELSSTKVFCKFCQ